MFTIFVTLIGAEGNKLSSYERETETGSEFEKKLRVVGFGPISTKNGVGYSKDRVAPITMYFSPSKIALDTHIDYLYPVTEAVKVEESAA